MSSGKELQKELVALRETVGIKREELVKLVGARFLRLIETGPNRPRRDSIVRYAKAIGREDQVPRLLDLAGWAAAAPTFDAAPDDASAMLFRILARAPLLTHDRK